jgi:hypothetical protein
MIDKYYENPEPPQKENNKAPVPCLDQDPQHASIAVQRQRGEKWNRRPTRKALR